MEENRVDEEFENNGFEAERIIEKKRYSIPFEMFEEAYNVFQKKYVYPRNMIMCGILILVAIGNIINIVIGNAGTVGYVLVMACLALAAVNWYNPKKIKKNLLVSIRGIENDVYTLEVLPEKLVVGTVLEPADEEREPEEYEAVFGETAAQEDIEASDIYVNNTLRVTERENFFLIYIKRSMFYIIPKNVFTDEEIQRFSMYFVERIGKYYLCEADK
ncbi:MAG: YcxB family protein [Porcipelethomonas sp.]